MFRRRILGIILGVSILIFFAFIIISEHPITSRITTVIIPKGVEMANSGKNYEPQFIHVVIGINSTVRWTSNNNLAEVSIIADNNSDQNFFNATHTYLNLEGPKPQNFLKNGESFEYTFAKAGYFGYHSEPYPWLRGGVTATIFTMP